jgi:hypothetical protein
MLRTGAEVAPASAGRLNSPARRSCGQKGAAVRVLLRLLSRPRASWSPVSVLTGHTSPWHTRTVPRSADLGARGAAAYRRPVSRSSSVAVGRETVVRRQHRLVLSPARRQHGSVVRLPLAVPAPRLRLPQPAAARRPLQLRRPRAGDDLRDARRPGHVLERPVTAPCRPAFPRGHEEPLPDTPVARIRDLPRLGGDVPHGRAHLRRTVTLTRARRRRCHERRPPHAET